MEQPCIAPLLGVSLNVISIFTPPLKTPSIGFHGQLSEVEAQQGKPQFTVQEPERDRLVSVCVVDLQGLERLPGRNANLITLLMTCWPRQFVV